VASAPEAAKYVAIITDGNGRWAQERELPTIQGHEAGADVVKARLKDAVEFGVEELTVYSFSTENWTRPPGEVAGLRKMFGRREGIAPELVERMEWAQRRTQDNDRITLFVAFNYGGRAEILDAAERYAGGGEEEFASHLYAPEMHEPDLLIRTSGEQRLSNYLLWQCAYSEFVFRDELWPDFTREAFRAALDEFEARKRRFGARA